ncbi:MULTISPECIES: pyrroline-5-carboxylate reductase [unclassified Rothia (in: high G+C Gram-positive bacteria)]|uniref:pyrroline-5-carboxylate reductase n=1 Tax=unclassified Rothia (in: high G+C Gram-positive bacteria) TaxID=2689056 RepID=UPI00195A7478|nr:MULTISPECIES: pyrroline-5-carboxylate reductase [unclassified Rothia (in: high G+C Gram-positive bacteria)]MBM7051955.1 pyrroline-5-carboxylate reductase [Rothia sp. ZJ1223]QRZ61978.1 pyrroline-5-carboxylate reductase [Rothia sp. ZJ932]
MSPTVAFCGTGSMNGAILRGLLASGFDPAQVRATTRSQESASALATELDGITVLAGESVEDANARAVEGADVVLLGVKPYGIVELAQEISPHLSADAVVISVAAGINLDAMERALPTGQPAVRCMPNTPSQVGQGVLAVSYGATVTDAQGELAAEILSSVGRVIDVAEDQMDAVVAVSGSGPAYAYLLAETMTAAGVKLGLDEKTAQELAAATVSGAGAMLEKNPDAESLRKAVMSPNGTTERAVSAFINGGQFELTETAMNACATRSAQMTEEFSK